MKKIMVVLLMVALFVGGAFAGEGFGITARIEGSLFSTTVGNGTSAIGFFQTLDTPHEDFALSFSYDDPDGLYGATLGFETNPTDGWTSAYTNPGTLIPVVSDAFAWVKIGNVLKLRAGKGGDYRAIEKIGGEEEFGVQWLTGQDFTGPGTGDVSYNTSDPFDFGSGLVANIFAGPVTIGLFAAPSKGFSVWDQDISKALPSEVETSSLWTGEPRFKNVNSIFDYQYGLSALYASDIVDVGAAFKLSRVGAESWNGIDDPTDPDYIGDKWGLLGIDFGVYGKIKAIQGLELGVGVAGQKSYADAKDDAGKYDPFLLGIGLDVKFTGVDKLTLGFYNNISLWTVPKNTDLDSNDKDISHFYLTDQLEVAYAVTEKLTIDARVQNFLQTYDDPQDTATNGATGTHNVDKLGIRAGVAYKVKPNAQVTARLQFVNTAYDSDPEGWGKVTGFFGETEPAKRNHFTFSIPVGIKVEF
jgi:hypothetical protein